MKLFRFFFAILLLFLMLTLIFFQHLANIDFFEENRWYFYAATAALSGVQFPILWFVQRFSFRKWLYPAVLLLYIPGFIWHIFLITSSFLWHASLLGLPLPAFCLALDIAAMVYTGYLRSKEDQIPNKKDA